MSHPTVSSERRLTVFSLVNSLLCSVMAVCLAAAAGRLISVIDSSWLGDLFSIHNGLIVGFFLVSLEVQFSRRLMAPRDLLSLDWLKAVAVEWFFLLIGLWGLIWLAEGPDFAMQDLQALSNWNFVGLIRPEYLLGLTLLLLVWGFNRYLVGDLMPLEDFPLPRSSEGLRDTEKAQSAARNRLWKDVFVFGGLMVFLSLVGAAVIRSIRNAPADIGPVGMETLVYFLCGLGVFAIGRWMMLRVDWTLDRTRFDAGIPRRWLMYSLGFIVIVIFLAAALPTDYSLSLLTSLNLAIQGLGGIVFILWALVLFPVLLLASSFISLLLGTPQATPAPPAEKPIADALPALPAGVTWISVLREIFFWVIAILVFIYLVRQILKIRITLLRRIRHWPILGWILDWLRKLENGWQGLRKAIALAVQNSLGSLREDFAKGTGWEPLGFVSLRRLTPRQSIRFYFFALLRRGAERGAARRPAQTPREYAAGLTALDGSIGGELSEMAIAFEEARYTAHAIGPDKARRVRKLWDTLRVMMRRLRADPGQDGKGER